MSEGQAGSLALMFMVAVLCVIAAFYPDASKRMRVGFLIVAALFGVPPLVRLWLVGVLG